MRKLLLALTLFTAFAMAADSTGNWSGEAVSEGDTHPMYFVLKQDGTTLTGSGGPNQAEQHPMKNGKVDAGHLTFDVDAGKGTFHFELTAEGDGLKGTVQLKTEQDSHSGTISLKRAS